MSTLSLIKTQVMYLFKAKLKVHIDISNRSGKKYLTNIPAVITAVYPNIFTPVFIFVFKWGMMGAAAATVIGQVVTAYSHYGICSILKLLKFQSRNLS